LCTAPQRSLASQSKNIPFVLRQKLHVRVTQLLDIMAQGRTHSLRDEEILADLISDNLSDVPEDIYSESDGASDIESKIKNVPHSSVCDSDHEISSDESTSYVGGNQLGSK
jgi:hypothetical protein